MSDTNDDYKAQRQLTRKLEGKWGKIFTWSVGEHILAHARQARVFRLIQGKRGDWQADIWYKNNEGWETRGVLMMTFEVAAVSVPAASELYRLVKEQQPACELLLPKGMQEGIFLAM